MVFFSRNVLKRTKVQAPGTIFSNFIDEAHPAEDMKSAVDLAYSRKFTKELISALPNFGSMETAGARRAEEQEVLVKKRR